MTLMQVVFFAAAPPPRYTCYHGNHKNGTRGFFQIKFLLLIHNMYSFTLVYDKIIESYYCDQDRVSLTTSGMPLVNCV